MTTTNGTRRRGPKAVQPKQQPVEETPMPKFSGLAVNDWRGAVAVYETRSAKAAGAAESLTAQAEKNERVALELEAHADNGEHDIRKILDDAEAAAKRVIDAAQARNREIAADVNQRRRDCSTARSTAQQQRENAHAAEIESVEAAKAALFTRAAVERACHEHNVMEAAPEPNEAAVERFDAAHDEQDAAEADGDTLTMPPAGGAR